jgi:hypothetical protein
MFQKLLRNLNFDLKSSIIKNLIALKLSALQLFYFKVSKSFRFIFEALKHGWISHMLNILQHLDVLTAEQTYPRELSLSKRLSLFLHQ